MQIPRDPEAKESQQFRNFPAEMQNEDVVETHGSDERFENKQKLGSGACIFLLDESSDGNVFLTIDVKTQKLYARKEVSLADEGMISISELRKWLALYFVEGDKLKHVAFGRAKLSLLFELAKSNLKMEIRKKQELKSDFSIDTLRSYMFQILSAVQYAHSHAIIHRDIKPENILVNPEKNEIWICDFGLARSIQRSFVASNLFLVPLQKYTNEVVTLWYRAPEVMLGLEKYSQAVDVWSCGCVFAELLTKKAFVSTQCEWGQLMKLFQLLGTPTEATWEGVTKLKNYQRDIPHFQPRTSLKTYFAKWKGSKDFTKPELECLDLIQKMLKLDPSKRITAKDALKHPFFADAKLKTASCGSKEITYVSQKQAIAFDGHLMSEQKGSPQYVSESLMEMAGVSVAWASWDVLQQQKSKARVLVVVGPGNNGGDGLIAARHLLFYGVSVSILLPKPYKDSQTYLNKLVNQCQTLDIPFYTSLEEVTKVNEGYSLIVDSLFGFSFRGDSIRSPYDSVIDWMNKSKSQILCVDVPSGWNIDTGYQNIGIKSPEYNISLSVPKLCVKDHKFKTHYLGGRFVPPKTAEKFGIQLPKYPKGPTPVVVLS